MGRAPTGKTGERLKQIVFFNRQKKFIDDPQESTKSLRYAGSSHYKPQPSK